MAVQAFGNGSNIPSVSTLDQQALTLLMSLRDNPEVQKDQTLFKMFNDTVSFMLASTTPQVMGAVSSSFIQIDTSGGEGEDGFPGVAACPGERGINGTNGSDGKDAGEINLHLTTRDGVVAAQWDNGNASVKLGDASTSIFLRAVGGKGGNGGIGGRGGLGMAGAHGRDACQFSSGTNGARGKCGGLGGNGGDGGNGGKGGDVKIYVSPEDSDLLMLLNNPELAGGAKGKGGFKGRGGIGGNGGEGGSSYSWTEIRHEPRQVYDIARRCYRMEYYTNRIPHFVPGGSPGSQGLDGDDGRVGDDGKTGMSGSFQMVVGGASYQTLYNLAITVSKIVDLSRGNSADIYEPGEQVNLMVSVINTGGMPTPHQDIEISLSPAQWIEQKNASLVLGASDHLPIEGSHTFSTPFSFQIKELQPFSGEPLDKQELLTYHALLRRVNKSFSRHKDLFSVKYPVQISSMTACTETSTLSLFIQNITSISMGRSGPQKRRVFVTFEISEYENIKSNDVELLKIEEGGLQERNKISVEVDHLLPKSEKELAVSFRFTNPELRVQSKVNVVASLYLDHFNSENSKQTRCIQKQTIQI